MRMHTHFQPTHSTKIELRPYSRMRLRSYQSMGPSATVLILLTKHLFWKALLYSLSSGVLVESSSDKRFGALNLTKNREETCTIFRQPLTMTVYREYFPSPCKSVAFGGNKEPKNLRLRTYSLISDKPLIITWEIASFILLPIIYFFKISLSL